MKDRLRVEVDGAIARDVFGSPYIIVDGEPFWGADRLPQVEKWLRRAGGERSTCIWSMISSLSSSSPADLIRGPIVPRAHPWVARVKPEDDNQF